MKQKAWILQLAFARHTKPNDGLNKFDVNDNQKCKAILVCVDFYVAAELTTTNHNTGGSSQDYCTYQRAVFFFWGGGGQVWAEGPKLGRYPHFQISLRI